MNLAWEYFKETTYDELLSQAYISLPTQSTNFWTRCHITGYSESGFVLTPPG